MASRYWVGGTGTWNPSNTTNWSATSGGAAGASVPTSADDVYFDALSGGGIVTLASGPLSANQLTTTTFGGNASGSTTIQLYGGTTTLNSTFNGVSLQFMAAASFSPGGASFNNVVISAGAGNTVTLLSGFTASACTITSGIFNVGASDITAFLLQVQSSGTLTLTTSQINCTSFTVNSLGTVNAGTSKITCSGSVSLSGVTVNEVVLTASSASIFGGGTINKLSTTNTTSMTLNLQSGFTLVVVDFAIQGSPTAVHVLKGSVAGSQATISSTAPVVSLQYFNIKDCIASGSTWICQNGVDSGNNTNWLFYNNSGALAFF